MSNIDIAIAFLEQDITQLGDVKEGEVNWFILRAKSTGLSLLKAARQQRLDSDYKRLEEFRRDVRAKLVAQGATVEAPQVVADAQMPVPGAVAVAVDVPLVGSETEAK